MLDHVFRPGSLGGLRTANRIVMGAMHLNLEARADGGAAMAAFYAERARGGAGLIVTGGCAVSPEGSGGRLYARIDDPARHAALAAWAEAVHREGGRIALQLFHAGRYAAGDATGHTPVAPSALAGRSGGEPPKMLDEAEIQTVIRRFADGAHQARALGFDAVEVMASEGYLLNQFLSPLTNVRDDAWGGDATRRMRFPLAVMAAVRAAVGPGFPVLFRVSGADLMPGSTPPSETQDFAVALARAGADALNIGVGWHESRVPTVQSLVRPGAWTGHAARIRRAVRAAGLETPVIASNRINRMELAERVLASGQADFVSMARPFLADPEIVRKARRPGRAPANICIACNEACIDRSLGDDPVSCMVNPRAGRELEFPRRSHGRRQPRPARLAVVGGGPAGLEGGRALAALGHHVELFEAADELGGQFRLARLVPGKEDFGETVRYFAAELRRLGVRVHLNRPLDAADADLLRGFDGVLLATGVVPRPAGLPGEHLPQVVDYQRAFRHPGELGRRVVVIGGGGVAVDLGHLLAGRHHEVCLLRRSGRIGEGMGRSTRWAVLAELRRHGVRWLTGVRYRAVLPQGVLLRDADGAERLVPADTVVVAAGQSPVDALRPVLAAAGVAHRSAGGAADARGLNAVRAVEEGMRAAHALAGEAERAGDLRRRAAVPPTQRPPRPRRTAGPASSAIG
ncbi:FAD-dependent oxidoreductase [Streptomyces sp. Ag109_O5-10]|uniref:oxidoreductase n=1 Tax=Streptomyces sp. Ag109_O5-10 TaxID=1855349 RepID=UPI00089CE10D|nr:FAD-dependent oxidoreductase [Streptomyces sp. Ag109_O5-10]SEF00454.1 2,4-dienoyl-CoA reductase (NADPH2) [Streptomyces sp. Ag109_O5-10]